MLGLNIAYYRKLNGFTQERLAEALNLDRTTISKIELAISGVSLDVIFEMCDLFSIPRLILHIKRRRATKSVRPALNIIARRLTNTCFDVYNNS